MMFRALLVIGCLIGMACLVTVQGAAPIPGFRPPAVPLVVNDPYFSIWSFANNLPDVDTTLWDGESKPLTGFIRVDKTYYRWLGAGTPQFSGTPMKQVSLTVNPTSTVYTLQGGGVQLKVTFLTPALPSSLDLSSRPVTYLTLTVSSTDSQTHDVELYFDASSQLAVIHTNEQVTWTRTKSPKGLNVARIGTTTQRYVGQSGDGIGINWGYLYIAADSSDATQQQSVGPLASIRQSFFNGLRLPSDNSTQPVVVGSAWPVLAIDWKFDVAASGSISKTVVLAYDDIYSMYYFGDIYKPYWTQLYSSALVLIDQAWSDYAKLVQECETFDQDFFSKMSKAGGDQYSTLTALAFRQITGGTKFVWNDKRQALWYFMKEISSDGDVSTMDVIFPASPFFLYYNASWLELLITPLLAYANNETWNKYNLAWFPHHLGQWPICNITAAQQENMPIEETGNLFLMLAGIAQRNPSSIGPSGTIRKYWPLLQKYGEYLASGVLPDPGNQLTTDDFAGPSPHNANLAAKGILGVGAYSLLCTLIGDSANATKYGALATKYAQQWQTLANPTNTDHFALRYDQPGWSLKYNLVWQNLLKMNYFPQKVFDMELAYYKTKTNSFGVPLDIRATYTKIDWESWIATFEPDVAGFQSFFSPLYKFASTTPQRVPLSDWYDTNSGQKTGFQARPVLGAFWLQALLQGV